MIWNPNIRFETETSPIVSHIAAEISEVCGDDFAIEPGKVEELAKAVESFLEREHESDVADSRYIVMLASKALSSIGEYAAGRRLLVFGTGLVKPAEWEVTGDNAMWVLDLREMMVSENFPLELIFFGSLGMVVESIAEIWDKTRGQGILGLKNIFSTAIAFLGNGNDTKGIALLEGEIKSVCERKLEQLYKERQWDYVPRVMNLDI
ncbi:MAG: hypothetical protein PHR77_17445 [Kiritimatiellae bacterium]|nr:hypothetical protein [Kiritimatiellia bacterium]MDD5521476.1 hypothetical protein [Kiritimatiellia bacterium]